MAHGNVVKAIQDIELIEYFPTYLKTVIAPVRLKKREGGETSVPISLRILASVCLSVWASAVFAQAPNPEPSGPGYAVAGLILGLRVPSNSREYEGYRCGPSDQFDGFTLCRKIRQERNERGSYNAMYSILYSRDRTIVYIDRYQEPAFFNANEAEEDIQRYSGKFGESSRITKMPQRPGGRDGILASWGKITLLPLEGGNVKAFADGRTPGKGYFIDFVGDFTRSAREGLPIFRIGGGAGFVWVASFNQRGRGIFRLTAADASAFQFGQ